MRASITIRQWACSFSRLRDIKLFIYSDLFTIYKLLSVSSVYGTNLPYVDICIHIYMYTIFKTAQYFFYCSYTHRNKFLNLVKFNQVRILIYPPALS